MLVFPSAVIWSCRSVAKLSLLCTVCLAILVITLFALVSPVTLLTYLTRTVAELTLTISKFGACRRGTPFSGVILSRVLRVRCAVCVASEFVR